MNSCNSSVYSHRSVDWFISTEESANALRVVHNYMHRCTRGGVGGGVGYPPPPRQFPRANIRAKGRHFSGTITRSFYLPCLSGVPVYSSIDDITFSTPVILLNIPPPPKKKKKHTHTHTHTHTEQSIFLGLCSGQQLSFSPCWIEHLVLIIITPRSSNVVENFLFYE